MRRLCVLCGKWFETNYNWQHSTCGCEDLDEAVHDELAVVRVQEEDKPMKCPICSLYFPAGAPPHTCGSADLAQVETWLDGTEQVQRELADPAVKARIAAGVRKEMGEE